MERLSTEDLEFYSPGGQLSHLLPMNPADCLGEGANVGMDAVCPAQCYSGWLIAALLFLSEDQADTILRDLGRWGGGKFYKLRRTF